MSALPSHAIQSPGALLRHLFLSAPKHRLALGLGIGASILAAITEPLVPALIKLLLDKGFTPERPFPIWAVPVAIVGLFTLRAICIWVSIYLKDWLTQSVLAKLRAAVYDKLLTARMRLFRKESAASLISASVFEPLQSLGMISNAVMIALRDGLTMVALLAYLAYLNWLLTAITIVVLIPVLLVGRLLAGRFKKYVAASQQQAEQVAYQIEESVAAASIIRVHTAQQPFAERFTRRNQALRGLALRAGVSSSLMAPTGQVLGSVALAVVMTTALWQSTSTATGGSAGVGSFVAFITAMLMLMPPLRHLIDAVQPVARAYVSLSRVLEILRAEDERDTGTFSKPRAQGHLAFKGLHVSLGTPPMPILKGITLEVKADTRVALVGPSGAGKTTLVRQIPRLAEATTGSIELDGVPVTDWRLDSLRQQISYVTQDTVLLTDTVVGNVCFGAPVDLPRVKQALADAALLDFALALPQGLDTLVGPHGQPLSGGQRQRLAIARALYKDAPVLILDEATSALDNEAERAVQQALERLMRGRTSIVIAHRLSTIENADHIVVMEHGQVAEQGTHTALLAAGGLYARLHSLQFRSAEGGSPGGSNPDNNAETETSA